MSSEVSQMLKRHRAELKTMSNGRDFKGLIRMTARHYSEMAALAREMERRKK